MVNTICIADCPCIISSIAAKENSHKVHIAKQLELLAGRGDPLHQRRYGKDGEHRRCRKRRQQYAAASAYQGGNVQIMPAEECQNTHCEYLSGLSAFKLIA